MTFGSLFAGIGGIDLGLERAGLECRFQVEIDPFCRKVLEKHWPEVPKFADVTKVTGKQLGYVDVLAGGFPCQDLSQAGKRAGLSGDRSGLWFEFARLIGEIRPRYVIAENVAGLLTMPGAMGTVTGELARLGYVGCNLCLRASDFGAAHLRKRVFIVAHAVQSGSSPECHRESQRRQCQQSGRPIAPKGHVFGFDRRRSELADAEQPGLEVGNGEREQQLRQNAESLTAGLPFAPRPADPRWPDILRERPDLAPALESPLRRVADGIPAVMDRVMSDRTKRLKALGNSVVPQCAQYIGEMLMLFNE